MKKKNIIIANWKMNPETLKEAKALFDGTKKIAEKCKNTKIIISTPSVYLTELRRGYRGKRIAFAVQNVHWEKSGAYTGEISAIQAKDVGAEYALVGHAERRKLGETNEDVGRKMRAVVDSGMRGVLCVGESERDMHGEYLNVVKEQILSGLDYVSKPKLKNVIIAYEPVWNIGGKDAMEPSLMHEMSIYIRKILIEKYGQTAMNTPVLYGGSVNKTEDLEIMSEGNTQGLLLGRASLDIEVFGALIKTVSSF